MSEDKKCLRWPSVPAFFLVSWRARSLGRLPPSSTSWPSSSWELYPNGIFVFNITKLTEYIRGNPGAVTFREVAVASVPKFSDSYHESYLETVDVSRPVIMAEIAPGRYNLIDGNHRMEQARRLGLKSLGAYWLSPGQHMRFLISERGYDTYIEYWNSKLK